LILDRKIKPIVDKSFLFEEIREAHDYLENSSQIGKVILLPE
jgi:NADPH:quinone reductase-like Zn-dependent oxidoreductase